MIPVPRRVGKFAGPMRDLGRDAECVRRYVAGDAAATIAADLGIGTNTVYRALKRAGIPRREEHAIVTEATERAVVDAVEDGDMTADEIAEVAGISKSTVTRILRERGLHLPKNPRQQALDEGAFDALTPEACYWIGFLFSDGSVSNAEFGKRQRRLAVNLAAMDRGHLEKFRAFLGSTHKISDVAPTESTLLNPPTAQRTIKSGAAVSFRVRSNRLVDRLVEYGLVPVKADRVPAPALERSRDYWRGVIDGDGNIGTDIGPGFYPNISLSGQPLLLASYQRFLFSVLSLSLRQGPVSTIQRVGTSGSTALDIIRLLYDGAPVALDRKLARAMALLGGFRGAFPPYSKAL